MRNYLELSRVVTVFASLLTAFGLYDQAWKIWHTRSANDFTVSLILALIFNEFSWLNYGLAIREWPIILICSLNIPAIIITTIGYWHYGRNRR